MSDIKIPKLSIGLPVFNGEIFLKKRLETIMQQSFIDYELIISDNCSTDNTKKICEEFLKNDSRVKFFSHNKNMLGYWNMNFVLEKSSGEYFVWAAVDDLWDKTFLEKNIKYLENNDEYVGSISKVSRYGNDIKTFEFSNKDNIIKKKYKKIRKYFRHFEIFSLNGNYNERIKKFLKNPSALVIYSVFRTVDLKKSIIVKNIAALDFIIILNVLEFGKINVLDEVLMKYYTGGSSSNGFISQFRNKQIPLEDLIFPYFSFLNLSRKKYGVKFLLHNSRFFSLFVGGIISNFRELFR